MSGITSTPPARVRCCTQSPWNSRPFRFSLLVLLLVSILTTHPASAQTTPNIAGTWQGTLPAGNGLRLILKVSEGDNAALDALFYSIDAPSGSNGYAATSISLRGSAFQFAVAPIDALYEGKLSADGSSITGTWTQGKQSNHLDLWRANADTAWAIPRSGWLG